MITACVESYQKMKLERIKKTTNITEEIHNITFESNMMRRQPHNRKPGRPKSKWTERALIENWNEIRKSIPELTNAEFNSNSENMTNKKEHASV